MLEDTSRRVLGIFFSASSDTLTVPISINHHAHLLVFLWDIASTVDSDGQYNSNHSSQNYLCIIMLYSDRHREIKHSYINSWLFVIWFSEQQSGQMGFWVALTSVADCCRKASRLIFHGKVLLPQIKIAPSSVVTVVPQELPSLGTQSSRKAET